MVYELAKTLQHTDGLERDFQEMASSLRDVIEKNYIQKIQMAAGTQKALAVEHPPKEVTLLRAIAPFLNENGKGQMQELSRSLLIMHTLQNVNSSVASITEDGALLAARSSDGAFENLDPQSAKIAGLLMALAVVEKF